MSQIRTLNTGMSADEILGVLNKARQLPSASELYTSINLKQDALTFDSSPTDGSSNSMTSGGIYNALLGKLDSDVDDAPTENSTKPITSGAVYSALNEKLDNDVDDAPTESSTNPITSGAVYSALSSKQDTLVFDTEPVLNSLNPVTSGGIYTELDDVYENISNLSGILTDVRSSLANLIDSGPKNRIKMKQTTVTVSGITITVNSDGTITLNGTNASSEETILIYDFAVNNAVNSFTNNEKPLMNIKTYTCVGTGDPNARIQVIGYNNLSDTQMLSDNYETTTFGSGTYAYYVMRLVVSGDASFDNVHIYPMVCLRSDYSLSASHVPYCPTSKELYDMVLSLDS